MYRSHPQATRGATPFLMREAIDRLSVEGVTEVTLCPVPGWGIEPDSRGGWLMTKILRMWQKRLNFLFNVQGLHHFKSRFRPEFQPIYVCALPGTTAGAIFSFLRVTGAMQVNFRNLFSSLLKPRKPQQPALTTKRRGTTKPKVPVS
jgi:lysylphosphatidylglycerol synthetase-like protein (DUF2156 family)